MKTNILKISRQRRRVRIKINEVQKLANSPTGGTAQKIVCFYRGARKILSNPRALNSDTAGDLHISNIGEERKGILKFSFLIK